MDADRGAEVDMDVEDSEAEEAPDALALGAIFEAYDGRLLRLCRNCSTANLSISTGFSWKGRVSTGSTHGRSASAHIAGP